MEKGESVKICRVASPRFCFVVVYAAKAGTGTAPASCCQSPFSLEISEAFRFVVRNVAALVCSYLTAMV